MTRPHASNLLVLETRQHVRDQRRRPNRVIIREENNIRRSVPDPMRHLQSLICERDGHYPDPLGVDGVGKVLQGSEHFLFSDDEDFFGIPNKPAVRCFFELFASINGGDNDGDIFGGDVGRIVWEGNGAVDEEGKETDAVPEISVEPGGDKAASRQ